MYRYILFDLDGTLSQSGPGIIRSLQYGLSAVGIEEHDPARLESFIGPPLNVQMKAVYGMADCDIFQAILKFRERYETTGLYECAPYDGLESLLSDVKAGGKILAVASSKPEPFVKKVLDLFRFSHFFSVICGSGIDDEMKNVAAFDQKAEVVAHTLSALQKAGFLIDTDKKDVVMVGDRSHDVRGAKANGLSAIGVTYGYGSREELEAVHADAVVDSVEELRALLLR